MFSNLYICVLVVLGDPGTARSLIFPLSSCLYLKIKVQSEHVISYQVFKKLRISLSNEKVIIIELQPPTRNGLLTTDLFSFFLCLYIHIYVYMYIPQKIKILV